MFKSLKVTVQYCYVKCLKVIKSYGTILLCQMFKSLNNIVMSNGTNIVMSNV